MSANPIKIERVPLPRFRQVQHFGIEDFCNALKALKVGESFAYPTTSYHRLGMSWARYLIGRRFLIQKGRVWRVA